MDLARHWAGEDGVPVVCLPSFSTDRWVTAAAFEQPRALTALVSEWSERCLTG